MASTISRRELVNAYRAGATFAELKARFRCSATTVYNVLALSEEPRRASGRAVKIDHAAVLREYAGGDKVAVIAARHGCSTSAVSAIVSRKEPSLQRRSRCRKRKLIPGKLREKRAP